MKKRGFAEALEQILIEHPEYERDAYFFLRDCLEFTVEKLKKEKGGAIRHVNASQFLEGMREYGLQQFGPMTITVLDFWGVRNCQDVGKMVFLLIEAGIFGKTENDSLGDFAGGYSFEEAFVAPYLPESESLPIKHQN